MLYSNESIALTHQAEALRQAKQLRLAREAQSRTSNGHLYARLAAASRGLMTALTQRSSSSKATARLDARHAR